MNALFIGGTGVISSACSPLAIAQGFNLSLLIRGQSDRAIPDGAEIIHGDIRKPETVKAALGDRTFDVVVDWVAFTPEHIETDLALFKDRVGQYIFISSASAYQTPPLNLPITESTPLHNPFWQYSRDKIACEERLMRAYRDDGFPITIVRPSHTYNREKLPLHGRYTLIDRMRKGKKIIVHGDGTSLWVLTHHRDFAKGFVGLMGNDRAISEAVHITSDEVLSWNQIADILAKAAGTEADIVHIPSEVIARYDAEWGAGLLGDKAHSMVFDNTKIKRLVPDFAATIPYSRGAAEVIAWHDADPARQQIDEAVNRQFDELITAWEAAMP